MRKRWIVLVLFVAVLTGCEATPTVIVPTLIELATETPVTPTVTLAPFTLTPAPTDPIATAPAQSALEVAMATEDPIERATFDALVALLTLESGELATGLAGATETSLALTPTETLTPSITPTLDPAQATFITFTPSATLDVTHTPRPTSTPSATQTPAPEGLELLALLAAQFTVLPPEIRYNPATQTGLALAVTAQMQTSAAPTASPTLPMGGIGDVPLATLPPSNPVVCAAPPPAVISSVLSSEPALATALGCPIGSSISLSGATQGMERGTMVYTAGSPGDIYAITSDMRFRRFADMWLSGVDPDSMGLTPPPGLLEPIRGFGKVWRENLDVQGSIGWGVSGEAGTTATLLLFERGRAIYLPTVNQTFILINDTGMSDRGQWRSVIGGF